MSWQGKHLLITGASGGIGLAIVEEALAKGAKVSVLSRTLSIGLKALECDALFVVLGDVASRENVANWALLSEQQFGVYDLLINNAGAMYYMDVIKPNYEQMKTMLETNGLGFIHLIDSVLPLLLKAKAPHWINITSDAGKQAFPGLAVYSGTKAFVEFTAKAMRQELLNHNVKITNIQPGNVDTPLHTRSTELKAVDAFGTKNEGQYLSAKDIVNAISYAISMPHHVAVNELLIEPLSESI